MLTHHSAIEYDEALRLRNSGSTYTEISQKLHAPRRTIWNWINRGVIPTNKRRELIELTLKKDDDFSYIKGVLSGDGSVYISETYRSLGVVTLSVVNKEFAEYFKERLGIWAGKKCFIYPIKKGGEQHWRVVLQSLSCSEFLIRNEAEINLEFLKGFYDSEGGILFSKTKNKNWYSTRISLTNSNLGLLERIQAFIKTKKITSYILLHVKKGTTSIIRGRKTKTTKDCWRLYIYNEDGIIWFKENVGFHVAKRQRTLLKCINYIKRPERQIRICVKCGYVWKSKVLNPPMCPKCYTRKWAKTS